MPSTRSMDNKAADSISITHGAEEALAAALAAAGRHKPTPSHSNLNLTSIESVRKQLIEIGCKESYPEGAIIAALRYKSDPREAALYLHSIQSRGLSPPASKKQRALRSTSTSSNASTITGLCIASTTTSSTEMLRSLSLPTPSLANAPKFTAPVAEENVTYHPKSYDRRKLTASAKGQLSVEKRFGKKSLDNFDGSNDMEKRIMRAAAETGLECTMKIVPANPGGFNESEREGVFAQCDTCEQSFCCLSSGGVVNDLFETHKRVCGHSVCGCGLDVAQLWEGYKALEPGKDDKATKLMAQLHIGNCKQVASDFITALEEWSRDRDTLIGKMRAETDDQKASARKKFLLPPGKGLRGTHPLIEHTTLGKEEQAMLLKKWTEKQCKTVKSFFYDRQRGHKPTTIEVRNALANMGENVDKMRILN